MVFRMPDTDSTGRPTTTHIAAAAEAAKQMEKWRIVRDRNVVAARLEGASLRSVSAAVGLHHSTVRVITAEAGASIRVSTPDGRA